MPIQFECPYCETISSVPDSFAGKQGKCPVCHKVIEVPDPNDYPAEDPPPAPTPPVPDREDDEFKTCKFCGEEVLRVAKKCRYCGELFDKNVQRRSRGDKPKNHMSLAVAGLVATLCNCFPVGIAAVVFAARVDSLYAAGDTRGAERAAQSARALAIASLVLGALSLGLAVLA